LEISATNRRGAQEHSRGNKYETMRCTAAAGLKKKWEHAILAIPTRLDGWENQNGFHIQTIFKLK